MGTIDAFEAANQILKDHADRLEAVERFMDSQDQPLLPEPPTDFEPPEITDPPPIPEPPDLEPVGLIKSLNTMVVDGSVTWSAKATHLSRSKGYVTPVDDPSDVVFEWDDLERPEVWVDHGFKIETFGWDTEPGYVLTLVLVSDEGLMSRRDQASIEFNVISTAPPPPVVLPPTMDEPAFELAANNRMVRFAHPEDIEKGRGTPGLILGNEPVIHWDSNNGSDSNSGASVNSPIKSLHQAGVIAQGRRRVVQHVITNEVVRLEPNGNKETDEFSIDTPNLIVTATPGYELQCEFENSGGGKLKGHGASVHGIHRVYKGKKRPESAAQPTGRSWHGGAFEPTGGFGRPGARGNRITSCRASGMPGGGFSEIHSSGVVQGWNVVDGCASDHVGQASCYSDWIAQGDDPWSTFIYGCAGLLAHSYNPNPQWGRSDENFFIVDYPGNNKPRGIYCSVGIANQGRGLHVFKAENVHGRYNTLIANNAKVFGDGRHAPELRRAFARPSELSAHGWGGRVDNVWFEDTLVKPGLWLRDSEGSPMTLRMQIEGDGGMIGDCGDRNTGWLEPIARPLTAEEARDALENLIVGGNGQGCISSTQGRLRVSFDEAWGEFTDRFGINA